MINDGDILWTPGPDARTNSRIGQYMQWLEDERDLRFDTYDDLWEWSVSDLDAFWRSMWDYFEVESATPVGPVLGRREMPGAEWFPGTKVNYAGEFLRRSAERPDEVAVIGVSQTRETVTYTVAKLSELIGRIRMGLQRLGVKTGDRVVAYMPNVPETVAAFLATASLGAIWASAAPEFGPQAVTDRFGQLEPVVLLVADGYRYGDKDIDVRDRVAAIREAMPSVRHTVALSYNGREIDGAIPWSEFTAETGPIEAVPVAFDHPLMVLFSSGTTGLPKAIVHGHGGIIIETFKSHALSWDLGPGDRLMWFSTTAWMMWNALVSALLTGSSIVCVDGNPMWPDLGAQWRIAQEVRPTMMGLGPAFIMACIKAGLSPADEFDLSSLRMLSAAGSPLPTEGFVWINEQFGHQAQFAIGSGGTDVCTGLVQGYPIVPTYAGEISTKCLGVAAYAYDEAGEVVVGELGELVITEPMPSMPVALWGDDDMARYRATYYEQYPGVMRFGDWVRFSEHGSSVIAGRSDATLNRGGVRIGTAEIYRIIELKPDVEDSLVMHLEDPAGGNGELLLFVKLTEGTLDDDMRAEIATSLRQALSPRHVPDTIIQVRSVPRSLTGKKLELPVKKIMRGSDPSSVASRQALADPTSLDEYIEFAERRS